MFSSGCDGPPTPVTDKASVDWALPEKPASTPWLAVVLLGVHHDLGAWLGDFERCMVWLLIEDVRHFGWTDGR